MGIYTSRLSCGGTTTFGGEVTSICTYVSDNGKTVWVGECEYGFLYGLVESNYLHSCRYLSVCFRFARQCGSVDDLLNKSQLKVDPNYPVPEKLLPEVAAACGKLETMSKRGATKIYDIELNVELYHKHLRETFK